MNKNLLIAIAAISLAGNASTSYAQDAQPSCNVSIYDQQYLQLPAMARAEQDANEAFTQTHIQQLHNSFGKSTAVDTYRVALVFHVYGTTFNGKIVSDTLIRSAVAKLNEDFHALNSDYNLVHQQYLSIRSPKNIKFYLAKRAPNGSLTTGIIYHPVQGGFANGSGYEAAIQADAWDNYKYINIYVQNDLFNDGVTNNSGYAYYPSTSMSDNNIARIVYNGAYIGSNTDPEFASTMTHELGHFFNLIHTFDGGCQAPNDNVADTPPCTTGQGCHPSATAQSPMNCTNQLINAENYMDYNTQCYRMFTVGQAERMDAALYMPSRVTLWQDSTNIITGIDTPVVTSVANPNLHNEIHIYPNPSNGIINIEAAHANFDVTVINALGQVTHQQSFLTRKGTIDLGDMPKGICFIMVSDETGLSKQKILIQ